LYIAVRRYKFSNPYVLLYIAVVCGYLAIGIAFLPLYEGEFVAADSAPKIYSIFVYASLLFSAFFMGDAEVDWNDGGFQSDKWDVAFFAVLPAVISVKVLYLGIISGSEFASQAWRDYVGYALNGLEYIFYKLWVLFPLLLVALPGKFGYPRVILLIAGLIASGLYGGRFIIFASLVLLFPFLSIKHQGDGFFIKYIKIVVFVFVGIVFLGMLRYSIETDSEISFALFVEAIGRQLTGVVYDFLLSYGLANKDFCQTLVWDKLVVASIPGVFKYDYEETLGGYLAEVSGRGFEFGHRIGGAGESYYLGGVFGVIVCSFVYSLLAHVCDLFIRSKYHNYLLATVLFFSLLFSALIDFSHILTGINMAIFVFFYRKVYRSFISKLGSVA